MVIKEGLNMLSNEASLSEEQKEELLFDISCMKHISQDGWIYYINLEADESIWRIKEDGSCNQSMHTEVASELIEILDGKWLRYEDEDGEMREVTVRGKYDREVE